MCIDRKVAIPALNDSPYIGMNVYNVVLTSIIVVFCDSLLSDRTTLNYLVVATLILISTTTALCLLFLPKVCCYYRADVGVNNSACRTNVVESFLALYYRR